MSIPGLTPPDRAAYAGAHTGISSFTQQAGGCGPETPAPIQIGKHGSSQPEPQTVACRAPRPSSPRRRGALIIAALLTFSPAQAATIAYDAQGPFLAVEADTYTGSKFDLVAPPATGGADPTVIIAIAVVLLACIFLCPDGDSDDPRTYASDGVIPPVSQVPLPAGGWLLLAALGALAARARR